MFTSFTETVNVAVSVTMEYVRKVNIGNVLFLRSTSPKFGSYCLVMLFNTKMKPQLIYFVWKIQR